MSAPDTSSELPAAHIGSPTLREYPSTKLLYPPIHEAVTDGSGRKDWRRIRVDVLLMPKSPIRRCWDLLMVCVLTLLFLSIPFLIAAYGHGSPLPVETAWEVRA